MSTKASSPSTSAKPRSTFSSSFGSPSNDEYVRKLVDDLKSIIDGPGLSATRQQKLNLIACAELMITQVSPNFSILNCNDRRSTRRELETLRKQIDRYVSTFDFHLKMSQVFINLRDTHCSYFSPEPLASACFKLPFSVAAYWYDDRGRRRRKYIVSAIDSEGWPNDDKHPEIVAFDGEPIEVMVYRLGKKFNHTKKSDVYYRHGVSLLTERKLIDFGIPKPLSVIVSFLGDDHDEIQNQPFSWKFSYDPNKRNSPSDLPKSETHVNRTSLRKLRSPTTADVRTYSGRRGDIPAQNYPAVLKIQPRPSYTLEAKRAADIPVSSRNSTAPSLPLHSSRSIQGDCRSRCGHRSDVSRSASASLEMSASSISSPSSVISEPKSSKKLSADETIRLEKIDILGKAASILGAEVISLPRSVRYGKLTITNFDPVDDDEFYSELKRVLALLPDWGLLIDIRGNPGGSSDCVKWVWELIFSASAPQYPMVLKCSKFLSYIFHITRNPLAEAIRTNMEAKQSFTGPLQSLTKDLRRFPRTYAGQHIILLLDSMSGSGADIFSSMMKDEVTNESTMIYGTDSVSQGGGSTSIHMSDLFHLLRSDPRFSDIPPKTDFTISYSRFYRTGESSGAMIEYFGVEVDRQYYESRRDILFKEEGMLEYFGRVFRKMHQRSAQQSSAKSSSTVSERSSRSKSKSKSKSKPGSSSRKTTSISSPL